MKKLSGIEQIMNELNVYYTLLFDEELNDNPHLPMYTFKENLAEMYPQFGNLKDIFYAWLFSSLICDALTQFLTSQNTFTPDQYYVEFLKHLNAYIIQLIDNFPMQKVDIIEDSNKIFFYLFSYYDFRDILLQNTYILKSITTTSSLENPQQKYIIPSSWNEREDITCKTIKKYFTEDRDEEVVYRTFCKQYNKCKDGIALLNEMGLNLENNYINQKVVYREILLNKTKYSNNRANSSYLLSKLSKNEKLSPSEKYFLSEKINMGIYREHGIIDAYYIENELVENLYHLISLTLSQLYPSKILDTLKHNNFKILDFLMSEKNMHTQS